MYRAYKDLYLLSIVLMLPPKDRRGDVTHLITTGDLDVCPLRGAAGLFTHWD